MDGFDDSSAAVIEPVQGVVLAAEHENKRQCTVSALLMIHAPEHVRVRSYFGSSYGLTRNCHPLVVLFVSQNG